jgi:hypothetical protein
MGLSVVKNLHVNLCLAEAILLEHVSYPVYSQSPMSKGLAVSVAELER